MPKWAKFLNVANSNSDDDEAGSESDSTTHPYSPGPQAPETTPIPPEQPGPSTAVSEVYGAPFNDCRIGTFKSRASSLCTWLSLPTRYGLPCVCYLARCWINGWPIRISLLHSPWWLKKHAVYLYRFWEPSYSSHFEARQRPRQIP